MATRNTKNIILSLLALSLPVSAETWVFCVDEPTRCYFEGTREVRYGAVVDDVGYWVQETHTGSVPCRNAVFGDPIPGTPKACYLLEDSPEPVVGVLDWNDCEVFNAPVDGEILQCSPDYVLVASECMLSDNLFPMPACELIDSNTLMLNMSFHGDEIGAYIKCCKVR